MLPNYMAMLKKIDLLPYKKVYTMYIKNDKKCISTR